MSIFRCCVLILVSSFFLRGAFAKPVHDVSTLEEEAGFVTARSNSESSIPESSTSLGQNRRMGRALNPTVAAFDPVSEASTNPLVHSPLSPFLALREKLQEATHLISVPGAGPHIDRARKLYFEVIHEGREFPLLVGEAYLRLAVIARASGFLHESIEYCSRSIFEADLGSVDSLMCLAESYADLRMSKELEEIIGALRLGIDSIGRSNLGYSVHLQSALARVYVFHALVGPDPERSYNNAIFLTHHLMCEDFNRVQNDFIKTNFIFSVDYLKTRGLAAMGLANIFRSRGEPARAKNYSEWSRLFVK